MTEKTREEVDKEAFDRYVKKYGLGLKTADRMPPEASRKAVDAFIEREGYQGSGNE